MQLRASLQQGIAEVAHRHKGVQQPQFVVAIAGGHPQVFDHHHPLTGAQIQG